MLIDYTQNKDKFVLSFVNDKKQIEIMNIPLKYGYYRYVKSEYPDGTEIPNLKAFKHGSLIKREPTKMFRNHNLNEFINFEVKTEYPEIYEKIMGLNIPNPVSVDIETDITDEFGYSSPEKAENKILSISVTDINLNSILFVLENRNHPVISEKDNAEIKRMVLETLGEDYAKKYEYKTAIVSFKTEHELLSQFLVYINKYFQSVIGWNFKAYDWLYITNRAKKLGINLGITSPTGKINKLRHKISDIEHIDIEVPAHRIIADYMFMFKDSMIYKNLESFSLNYVSGFILGLNKVVFSGNLRKLYEQEYNKFLAYAFVDTILVMLIHKTTNLYSVDFFECYKNKIFYAGLCQNSISESLIYNTLREKNIFYLEDDFNRPEKRSYLGAYVKAPTKKFSNAMVGIDFSSLYPNSIITCGISPERKVDSIETVNGKPKTLKDEMVWQKYAESGNYILSPMGRIYENSTDGLYVEIEKRLIAERSVFTGYKDDIYINIIPRLENEITKRGLTK